MILGQTTRVHFPFESLFVSWDVTTHPPASYLPESHLMVNIHTRRHRRHARKPKVRADETLTQKNTQRSSLWRKCGKMSKTENDPLDGFVILDLYVCVFILFYFF